MVGELIEGTAERIEEQPELPAEIQKPQPTDVTANAVRAFSCLMNCSSAVEVYAAFGILSGKFAEFCSQMQVKLAKQQAEETLSADE